MAYQHHHFSQYGRGVGVDGRVGIDPLSLVPSQVFYRAAVRRQKGYGLGGIFGTIARHVLPFAKKYILPHAKKAVSDIAVDVFQNNRPIKESVKHRSFGALKSIGKHVLTGQSGQGRRRKPRKNKTKQSKNKASNKKPKKNTKRKQKKTQKKKSPKNNQLTFRSIFDK